MKCMKIQDVKNLENKLMLFLVDECVLDKENNKHYFIEDFCKNKFECYEIENEIICANKKNMLILVDTTINDKEYLFNVSVLLEYSKINFVIGTEDIIEFFRSIKFKGIENEIKNFNKKIDELEIKMDNAYLVNNLETAEQYNTERVELLLMRDMLLKNDRFFCIADVREDIIEILLELCAHHNFEKESQLFKYLKENYINVIFKNYAKLLIYLQDKKVPINYVKRQFKKLYKRRTERI